MDEELSIVSNEEIEKNLGDESDGNSITLIPKDNNDSDEEPDFEEEEDEIEIENENENENKDDFIKLVNEDPISDFTNMDGGEVTNFNPEEESSDEEDEDDYKKMTNNIDQNYLQQYHPESSVHNYEEIYALAQVVRNDKNVIIDQLHKTIPILTKFEKAKIIGQRAKQINSGSIPYIKTTDSIINGHLIAEEELKQKKIPYIIRRPIPSGGSEYWKVKDLEVL